MELDAEFKAGHPIWQGDLIGLSDWENAQPFDRFAVVITADCDIARARSDKDLIYLRIVTQLDYIEYVWAREKLEKILFTSLSDLTKSINRLRKQNSAAAIALEQIEVERWLNQATANEICDSIQVTDAKESLRLKESVERTKGHIALYNDTAGKPCLSSLCQATSKPNSDILKTAAGELSRLPNDLFFISGFQEPNDQAGYYVLLDRIGTIRLDQITDSLAEIRSGMKTAYRFNRLNRQFKYAMVQQFAFLFQRIGLPDQHKSLHAAGLSSIQSSISGKIDA